MCWRTFTALSILTLVGAAFARGESLEGERIILDAGSHMSVDVPLSLPYSGPPPTGKVVVVEPKTGKKFPAMVRNGALTFISEGAMPNTTHEYDVQVLADSAPPHVVATRAKGQDSIEICVDDRPFTTYHFRSAARKPYLWPLLGDGGISMTRDWPMGKKEESSDHPHHTSVWTGYGDINGTDCWTEGAKSGSTKTIAVDCGSGDAYGWILAKNQWLDKQGKPIVDEEREYRFYAVPSARRMFDVFVTFTASHGDVTFGDTKEGGLIALRVSDAIRAERKGTIVNADGLTGEKDCWGKASAWCDYGGPFEDGGIRGIAVFDHPSNLRYPTRWHVRDYGLMAANPFGESSLTEDKTTPQKGRYTLKAGESVRFQYRVFLHAGTPAFAKVADRYADFATPPIVRWAD